MKYEHRLISPLFQVVPHRLSKEKRQENSFLFKKNTTISALQSYRVNKSSAFTSWGALAEEAPQISCKMYKRC